MFQYDALIARAESQQNQTIDLNPRRGPILDRYGRVLAYSVDADVIYAVPSEGGFRTPRAPLGESAKEERMRRLSAELLISAEASANLQAWAHEARQALSDATLRAYATDSRLFADWCRDQGIPTLPASPATVAAFLRHDPTKSVATIRRRAATIIGDIFQARYGSTISPQDREQGLLSLGISPESSESDIREGLDELDRQHQLTLRTVEAGYPPAVVRAFRSAGGIGTRRHTTGVRPQR